MSVSFIYVTVPHKNEAQEMVRALLEQNFIACANILEGMTSLYKWEGCAEESVEVVMLLKTTQERAEEVMKEVERLHSYDCPCIVEIKAASVNDAFAQWAQSQVQSGG